MSIIHGVIDMKKLKLKRPFFVAVNGESKGGVDRAFFFNFWGERGDGGAPCPQPSPGARMRPTYCANILVFNIVK